MTSPCLARTRAVHLPNPACMSHTKALPGPPMGAPAALALPLPRGESFARVRTAVAFLLGSEPASESIPRDPAVAGPCRLVLGEVRPSTTFTKNNGPARLFQGTLRGQNPRNRHHLDVPPTWPAWIRSHFLLCVLCWVPAGVLGCGSTSPDAAPGPPSRPTRRIIPTSQHPPSTNKHRTPALRLDSLRETAHWFVNILHTGTRPHILRPV